MKRIFFLLVIISQSLAGWAIHTDSTKVFINSDSIFSHSISDEEASSIQTFDILSEELDEATSNDSIQRYVDLARSLLEKIRTTQNFITNIDANSRFDLPAGISKTIGGLSYDIAIHAMRLLPTHAELDVFMQFEIPQNGKTLTFMAKGIKLSYKGGIIGDARLELLGDYGINFSGDKIQLILRGGQAGSGTYVTMDCDGFKEMGLDASVVFSRDLLLPENLNGTIQPEGRVSSSFKSVLSNWNDLVVQLSLPNFQVNGLKGFGFAIQDAVFDFSDVRNAPAITFPEGYNSNQMLPDNSNLWRGFYMRELTVRLPEQFKNKDNVRTTLSASNLIIDNQGVSGVFTGKNLIPLSNGDMNGWAFSLDSLSVSLAANRIQEAGFKGNIVIPVSDEQSPFHYTATIGDNDDYQFIATSSESMQFSLWQTSKVNIYPSSRLEIKVADGKFMPKAVLHGNMNIQAKIGDKTEQGKGVELADIRFENLEIQSVKPYIKVGVFSFGSEAAQQKMAQFPVSIKNIGLRTISDYESSLDFDLLLNLVGEESGAFAADAGLSLISQLEGQGGRQRWRPKKIEVHQITVDIDGGAFKLNGSIAFYKDDISYGNGFNGIVNAEFKPGIKARASAIFGNVNGMRYWYADALAEFPTPIMLFPGLGAKGFGGGAYFRMKMDNTGGSELGRTASGIVYVPEPKAGLGIKASIVLASMGSDKLFNGDLTLETSFFQGGGIRYISLLGNGQMLSPGLDAAAGKLKASAGKMVDATKKLEASLMSGLSSGAVGFLEKIKDNKTVVDGIHGSVEGKEGIAFRAFIDYDFENRVLHGNFEAFINVAGGVIKGVGAGGRAGWAVMHFAPSEWYVYVGTPDDRLGLSMGIGPIKAQSGSYFTVGTKIPGSPPPPDNVSRILGGKDLDYMKDLNAIESGAGIAFGSAFSISTGDLQVLIFYAKFEAGAGFDIMLKNYGETYCSNTGKKIGVNGWYANGQAYAYFEGAIGIRVKVFGKKRSVEILSIGAAAILQAQLPNPIWLQGTVGGQFSVLGGLVKGNCRFEVTLGEKCEMIKKSTSVLDDIKVIADMTPIDAEKDVNVFNTPQVVFNMPVNKNFDIAEEDGSASRSFRIKLDNYKISVDGQEIVGTHEWNESQDVVAFNSFEILPPKKIVKAFVQVSFEENIKGEWRPVFFEGTKVTETKQVTFTTGEAPDYIPLSNVDYSYPIVGQLNFYKEESREGYIKLKRGQSYLFNPGAEWRQAGRFTANDGTVSEFDFAHNNGTVTFAIPELKTNQVHAFGLVNIPKQQGGTVDRNVKDQSTQIVADGVSTDTEIKKRAAQGTIESLQEKSIFNAYFKSSQFGSVDAKFGSLSLSRSASWQIAPGIDELNTYISGVELFDKFETGRLGTNENTIQFEAVLDNAWYKDKVYPLVYEGYPLEGQLVLRLRNPDLFGVPPVRAINFSRQTSNYLTQENPIFSNTYDASYITYNLPMEMSRDYIDLLSQAADLSLRQSSPRLNYILTNFFPVLTFGIYKVKIKHVLPGINKVTSEKTINLTYQN